MMALLPETTKPGSDKDEKEKELQRQAIERLKQRCTDMLARIQEQALVGAAIEVGAAIKQLYEVMKTPLMPRDFFQQTATQLKQLELLANMKAADQAVRRAVVHAQADRKLERNQEVTAARGFLRRAVALGANEEFKRGAEMAIESATLTGGVRQKGPTRAKPEDNAPVVRPLAKQDKRHYKRYTTPVLRVGVGTETLSTLDWSLGGVLLDGCTVDDYMSGQPLTVKLVHIGDSRPVMAQAEVVRIDAERRMLALRFAEVTPELSGFLRRMILSRAPNPGQT